MIRGAAFLCAALALVACGGSDPRPAAPAPSLEFEVAADRRVEVLSVLARLAGVPPYGAADTAYARAVDERFAAYRDHPAVRFTRGAAERFGVAYDAPMSLAVHLDGQLALEPSPSLDRRWDGVPLDAYVAEIRQFVADSGFDAFLEEQAPYVTEVERRFEAFVADTSVVGFLDDMFGERPGARYRLVPGLLSGPYSFGLTAGDEVTPILSLETPTLEYLAHEVAHAYVNPLMQEPMAALRPVAQPLYETVADAMADQAYPSWQIMVNESIVRAVTVLFLRAEVGADEAARSLAEQDDLSFTWTGALVDAIDALPRPVTADALAEATRRVFGDAL